ncbi:IS3 family transposase [Kocuria rosea]|uniref:IS3 family transposase n=1 Tax=Kocuria rosea TaxID=1275 RepID=UPI0025B74DF6|nr:IS3 family transposase [Kocuria rosea]WJZ65502.1 IS3 family transposase [Kocuria rosea]
MPKMYDAEFKARAVRMVQGHQADYGSVTAASVAVGAQLGVARETLRRWVSQAEVDAGSRTGVTSKGAEEIKQLKAENKRLREANEILRKDSAFFASTRPPQPLIAGFIDQMRAEDYAVESICAVLRQQGVPVAARTYRSWKQPGRQPAARTVSDAIVMDALLAAAGTPEGLYGRRKMTAYLRRSGLAVAHCTVDRLMRDLWLAGVVRGRRVRTTVPAKDGIRAGDQLNRDFTTDAPNTVWVADFTYVHTWAGFAYVAFIVNVIAQRIVSWNAATTRTTDLVLTCLRMGRWDRTRQWLALPEGLIHHHDAGSQYTALRFTEHLAPEGMAPSIGSVGDAYDCLMESIIGLYKTECIRPGPFVKAPQKTVSDVEYATMAWVDWYNTRRLHSSLGNVPPAGFEAAHYNQITAPRPETQLV